MIRSLWVLPMFSTGPRQVFWLGLLLLLLQCLLIVNPGYFSHDELQWGAFSNVEHWRLLPWMGWWDSKIFQYRPLTFNLWMLLSHFVFDRPLIVHFFFVLFGTLNGVALFLLLRRLKIDLGPSLIATLCFVLGPYGAYVHGWVATLADILWVGIALLLAHGLLLLLRKQWPLWLALLLSLLLTIPALMAKEAALAIPALLGLVWMLSGWQRFWGWAFVGSCLPALVYLAIRLPVLLWQPRDSYGITLWDIPKRWLEYYLFVPDILRFEIGGTWYEPKLALLAFSALMVSVSVMLWRAYRPGFWLFTLGGALALGPVLILEFSANQYGYGFAAVIFSALAMSWQRLQRPGKLLTGAVVVCVLLHGFFVQAVMHKMGRKQAVFQPALIEVLQQHDGVLRLQLPERFTWFYQRITHDIPSYRGVKMGDRVQLVDSAETAHYRIADNGELIKIQ
ncbi:MAG TPA: hypothetical protein VIC08_07510 [Cellvibrionaceae bacterium]